MYPSRNLPVIKIDQLVLEQFAEHVLSPKRLAEKLAALRAKQEKQHEQGNHQLKALQLALHDNDVRTNRLYQAIEEGFLSLDSQLQTRVTALQRHRAELLAQLASMENETTEIPARLNQRQMEAFCSKIKEKLFDSDKAFARRYLHAMVSEIKVEDKILTLNGSLSQLQKVAANRGYAEHRCSA